MFDGSGTASQMSHSVSVSVYLMQQVSGDISECFQGVHLINNMVYSILFRIFSLVVAFYITGGVKMNFYVNITS